MLYFGLDIHYWIIMMPFMLLALWAQTRVKSAYKKYSKYGIHSRLTGAQVAQQILRQNGLSHVGVTQARGFLSDHYDPTKQVVRLSPEVYQSSSIAAVGIAAHETGHAVQHAKQYTPLVLRNMIAPTAAIGSNMAFGIIILGFFMGFMGLVKIGVVLFSIVVVFQLITLPVELDASARAKRMLASYGIVSPTEMHGVSAVLNAAAMTYVAAAASAVAQLIYFLLRSGLLGGGDD